MGGQEHSHWWDISMSLGCHPWGLAHTFILDMDTFRATFQPIHLSQVPISISVWQRGDEAPEACFEGKNANGCFPEASDTPGTAAGGREKIGFKAQIWGLQTHSCYSGYLNHFKLLFLAVVPLATQTNSQKEKSSSLPLTLYLWGSYDVRYNLVPLTVAICKRYI